MKIVDVRKANPKSKLVVDDGDVIELQEDHFALVVLSGGWTLVSLNDHTQNVTEIIGTWNSKSNLEKDILEYWPDAHKVDVELHIKK